MRCPGWRSRSAGAGEYRDRSEEKKRGEPKACLPARAEELGGVHLRATRRKLIIRRFSCAEAAEVWPPFAPMLELAHPLGSTHRMQDSMRPPGMRDMLPDDMERFRLTESAFRTA